jgi:hypothetical protein
VSQWVANGFQIGKGMIWQRNGGTGMMKLEGLRGAMISTQMATNDREFSEWRWEGLGFVVIRGHFFCLRVLIWA